MTICVVDGRGGGLGSRMVEGLRGIVADGHAVIGVGLNRVSAEAMARAGATAIETAPQAIHHRLHAADMIVGSLSLLMPGSMFGEVTPGLVQTLLESQAKKVLLPVNKRKVEVVGAEGRTLDALIDHAVQRIAFLLGPTA
ncbi:MAG: hypothetical protein LZF60_310034 [Nitrospira sp.]|nr:DUF3842 family protein [Nitrospira sp.]ULA61135.1 MAG: hypothetical protein LZF60_310034 [Nitrospira sp.]